MLANAVRPDDHPVDHLIETLRAADRLIADAVVRLGDVLRAGEIECRTGLPAEMTLRLAARMTGADAHMLALAAGALRDMPATRAAFTQGLLGWGQVRGIVCAVRALDVAGRAAVDRLVEAHAPQMAGDDPDALLQVVEDEVARLRADLALAREDRAIERSFLWIQPRMDGSGGSLYGETDAASLAAIAGAVDAAAERPSAGDGDGPSRARQRMEALVSICESSLSGGAPGGTPPRPRLIATVDLAALAGLGLSEGARVLASVAGRPGRITPLAAQVLACDAEVVPVLFSGVRPVGVGDTSPTVPARVRTALVARDGGCRFPGCGAPEAWCDAHHILPRHRGGTADVCNLLLLCRRCHRRVHRQHWRITSMADGAMRFRSRGRAFTSVSRSRPPPRE